MMKNRRVTRWTAFRSIIIPWPDGSGSKGSATDFTPEDYYWTMGKCLDIENCIKEHSAVMDKYDP